MGDYYPYFTQDTKDGALPEQSPEEPTQYIANIQDGTKIGYKYFRLQERRNCLSGHAEMRREN